MRSFPFKIFLSASVPLEGYKNYHKIDNAQLQIEEAVIALCRNIFAAGGQIIFGGHPSISPLVALVATEYKINGEDVKKKWVGIEDTDRLELRNRSVQIYQSEAFRKVMPTQTDSLYNLGYASIHWTPAIDGELFDPEIKGTSQCLKSLALMRTTMIRQPLDAMVCIGGMEGVETEFQLFKEYHFSKKIFLLKSSGGASQILADKYRDDATVNIVDGDIDSQIIRLSDDYNSQAKNFDEDHLNKPSSELDSAFEFIPYSYITARIVREIDNEKN